MQGEVRVSTRLTAPQVANVVANVQAGAVGRVAGLTVADAVRYRIGNAMLSKVKQWFIARAAGQSDPAGLRWQPLSKRYLAYGRRFGKGEQAGLKKAAGLGSGNRSAPGGNKGLLSGQQLVEWRQAYSRALAGLSLRVGEREAKGHAAAYAWSVVKAKGARTKLDVYGNRSAQILRDTGVLFNSLAFAVGGDGYAGDRPSNAPGQVFELRPDSVTVGTNVPYAAKHHEGRGVPQRRLWPEPRQWPDQEWREVLDAGQRGMVAAIIRLIT